MQNLSDLAIALFRTATGLVLGIMLFLTFGIAPALFRNYPSAEAGAIMGKLFPVYYHFIYAGIFVALLALIVARHLTARFWPVLATLIFAAVFIASNEFQIGPAAHRALELGNRAVFGRLHGISMILNLLSMLAIAASIFLIGLRRKATTA